MSEQPGLTAELGALLRSARLALPGEPSADRLARRAALSGTYVLMLEKGRRTPRRHSALRLADALGLPDDVRRELLEQSLP